MSKIPDHMGSPKTIRKKKKSINWAMVRARFLAMSPSDFGNGSNPRLAKMLGVGQSSLHRERNKPNSRGLTWDQERERIYKEIEEQTSKEIVDKEKEQKLAIIQRDQKKLKLMDEKIIAFLESDSFKVNNENLNLMIKSVEKIKENYSKIMGFLTSEGKGKTSLKFNLNVPPKYLNKEGREWIKRQVENPFDNVEEADFEVIESEEDMQRANLKMIEEL